MTCAVRRADVRNQVHSGSDCPIFSEVECGVPDTTVGALSQRCLDVLSVSNSSLQGVWGLNGMLCPGRSHATAEQRRP